MLPFVSAARSYLKNTFYPPETFGGLTPNYPPDYFGGLRFFVGPRFTRRYCGGLVLERNLHF